MKMKKEWTIRRLADALKERFSNLVVPKPDCYNRHPGKYYCIVGEAAITKAIMKAGLPVYNFWSGSNLTPSSQAPEVVVEYAYQLAYYEQKALVSKDTLMSINRKR